MNKKPTLKIGIIGDALAPHFNEAFANEMRLLSQELKVPILTCNNLRLLPFRKMEQYLIINGRFLREERQNPLLSLINGAFFYFFVKLFERKFDVIFLSGGIDSGFLNHLDLKKCILIINSISYSNDDTLAKTFSWKFAPKVRGVIAQSQRIKARLAELRVDREKIYLIYPWVDLKRFNYTEPPSMEEFRVLFASAPNKKSSREDLFTEKGLPLLLESFAEFIKHYRALLYILWRGECNDALYKKIKELNLGSHVEVINEVADIPSLYTKVHVTVIPFLGLVGSPEIPLSAVESLACGRPVVTTDVAEIAEIVTDYGCGCVAKPIKKDFLSALVECKRSYSMYQVNCCKVAEELFSLNMEQLIRTMTYLGERKANRL